MIEVTFFQGLSWTLVGIAIGILTGMAIFQSKSKK